MNRDAAQLYLILTDLYHHHHVHGKQTKWQNEHDQNRQNVSSGDGTSEVDVGVGASEGSIGGSRARVSGSMQYLLG